MSRLGGRCVSCSAEGERADAAGLEAQAKQALDNMTAQYEAVRDIVETTKSEAEEAVTRAREDRSMVVKELRRLQDKEKETRDINALREKDGGLCKAYSNRYALKHACMKA